MKALLVDYIKRAITTYVIRREGSQYIGSYVHDLNYIEHSRYIASYRKKDIISLCHLLGENSLSATQLFESIYTTVKTMKTGYLLFGFIPQETIDGASVLREIIYKTLSRYDDSLFQACECGRILEVACQRQLSPHPQDQLTEPCDIEAEYIKLSRENDTLKKKIQKLETRLSETIESQTLLREDLKQSLAMHELLQAKLTQHTLPLSYQKLVPVIPLANENVKMNMTSDLETLYHQP